VDEPGPLSVADENRGVDNDTYRAEIRRARRSRILWATTVMVLTLSFGAAGQMAQHVRHQTSSRQGD
jgi:hypothetical protein